MKITELKKDSVIFLLINLQHTKIMKKENHNAVPDSVLTKEFFHSQLGRNHEPIYSYICRQIADIGILYAVIFIYTKYRTVPFQ